MQYDFSRVAAATEARIQKGILPGAVLCVHIGGKRVYEYCGGYSDIEARRPLKKDAMFRLASMTKPITAAAVLIEQDRGHLSVKDEVCKYLPAFTHRKVGKRDEAGRIVEAGDALRDMTIEDILTHSSGLGSGDVGDEQYARLPRSACSCPAEMTEGYAGMLLDFSPGTSQLYSALTALDVAARIVEITSGKEYETYLQENIFRPLGMTDTHYRVPAHKRARAVAMYRLNDAADGMTREDMPTAHAGFPAGCVCGATGLWSTMDDYAKFADMLCGEGEANGVRVLSQAAVRALRTPRFPLGFPGIDGYSNWGYAVRVRSVCTPEVQELSPGSYGWSGAYNTHFWVDPVKKLTAVYMSNLDNAGGAGSVTAFEFECNVMRSPAAKQN